MAMYMSGSSGLKQLEQTNSFYSPKQNMSPTATPNSAAFQGAWPTTTMYRPSRFRYPVAHPAAYGSYTTPNSGSRTPEWPGQTYTPRNMPAASPNTTSSQSSNHSSGSDQLSRTNLYIRGLNPNTTDKDLVNLCQPYGKIISTKAIIDEATNKCKGYGFVDFENPQAAEVAVQALQAQGIQAQMAKNSKTFSDGTSLQDAFQGKKVDSISRLIRQAGGIGPMLHPRVRRGQQEQDPTNLYIANLPIYFSEQNLENMFKDYGTVISTRILRKPDGISRGVGFARMESKDKCDQIITAFNAKILPGCTEPLLVKFADGGNKKKNPLQQKLSTDTLQLAYDQAALAQNGLYMPYSMASPSGATALMTPAGLVPRYTMAQSPAPSYQVQSAHAGWAVHPQYIMQPQMAHMIPSTVHPGNAGLDLQSMLPTLTTQMGQLHLSSNSYAALTSHGYTQIPYQAGTILQTMPVEDPTLEEVTQPHFQAYTSNPFTNTTILV